MMFRSFQGVRLIAAAKVGDFLRSIRAKSVAAWRGDRLPVTVGDHPLILRWG